MTSLAIDPASKDALLLAILPNIAFDGWSMAALRLALQQSGQTEGDVQTLFPGGISEIALWLDDWADRQMLDRVQAQDLAALKVRERIAACLAARLAVLAPYREAVRLAMAQKASPAGAARAAQIIYRTVAAMWDGAGDAAAGR